MAIRISCPSCDASLSFDDAKRGKKVTCKKCEESFTVPSANGKAKTGESAIQNGRKMKAKSSANSDEDDERPAKKKAKAEPKKGGMGLVLILGGGAAVLLLMCVGVVGSGAYFLLGGKTETKTPIAANKDAHETEKKDGEPKKAGEPKKEGEPKDSPKKDPEPKVDPLPKTGPPPLPPDLERVKQATVFVSAQLPTGVRSEGSGFFTVEPGLILTNAHVLGMLDPNAPMPTNIEVTLYPGEPNQAKLQAALLGVDRSSDLAVLRVNGAGQPTPLILEDSTRIIATQQVQIASHPVEQNMRKAFMLTPTTIASLRKAPTGKLDGVHVGAGISRANSGGPVVTSAGKVVGIAGNDAAARRATAGDAIKRFLDGSIGDANIGKVVGAGPAARVSVNYPLIDPLQRVKEARVEVWSGPPGANRPYSYVQPAPLPGDGARRPVPLAMQKNSTTADVTLPTSTPPGQVVWLQPVIVLKDNTTQWGVATSVAPPPPSPYDLRPANLTVKLFSAKERTVNLKATFKSASSETRITASILEQMTNGPADYAKMKNGFGFLSSTDGQNQAIPKATLDLVRPLGPTYMVDTTNRIANRTYPALDPKLPMETRDPAVALQYQIATAYETGYLLMPNRVVKPGETWQTYATVAVRAGSKTKTPTCLLDLNATYEGFLTRNGRTEAIITVTGKLSAVASPTLKKYEGTVTGTLGFDESAGYLSSTQLKIAGGTRPDSVALDVDIKRTTGNTANIQIAQDPGTGQPDPKNTKGKTLIDQKGNMVAGGGFDPQFTDLKKKRFAYKQDIPLRLDMGKNYTFHITNAAFDSYMKLYGPMGIVAQGGGAFNTSKITYRAPVTGVFTLSVISHNGKLGGYHLKVQEAP